MSQNWLKGWWIACLFLAPAASADIIGYAGGATVPGLYRIDPASGTATFVTAVQQTLSSGGLGYLNGTFYATNYTANSGTVPPETYGSVNPATGAFTPLGTQTSANWLGFAANDGEGVLYVMDIDDGLLRKVSPGGAVTTIGSGLGLDIPLGIRGMAYDDAHGVLYATDYYDAGPNLYTIDTTTGKASRIGSLGFPFAQAGGNVPLAYDEQTQTLYAASAVGRSLYRVDVQTGAATLVGAPGGLGVPIGSMTWFPAGQPGAVPLPTTAAAGAALLAGYATSRRRARARRPL